MQAKCQMIFSLMEDYAPPDLAMDWDNSGLQVGDPDAAVGGIMLALDIDEEVCREAAEKNCQLIITHHPLFFKDLKRLDLRTSTGSLVAGLIRSGITLYAAHTNLDCAPDGVNAALARILGLKQSRVLKPSRDGGFLKLVVFVPAGHEDEIREALTRAGAGWIGNYSDCTFETAGAGTFRPLGGTNPYIGKPGRLERVNEIRLETIVPERLAGLAVEAMRAVHPYEEVAYDLYPLKIKSTGEGLGRVGDLTVPLSLGQFSEKVKSSLGLPVLRVGGEIDKSVARVALCGGSGADLWPVARAAGADVLVTGDVGYHAARDMVQAGFCFIDAGHYGTERVILPLLRDYLEKECIAKGLEVRVHVCGSNGDPYVYL
ncbi:MAG: NGG1p interacting factor 3 protein, NIF3 [Peptococcaceae bacterium BRH_c4b]|nr:MAG: NGG1p interacting factor 3 protein, NIF3 [Peptococcaceae bacterium BRH_c4b]